MITTKQIWLALMLLPLLCACQSDDIENDIKEEIPEETPASEPLTIKATIGGDDKSRAQVKYGNQDNSKGEFFMWNLYDKITVCKVSESGIESGKSYSINNAGDINGKDATFTMSSGETAPEINIGDEFIALYNMNVTSGRITIYDLKVPQSKKSKGDDRNFRHLQKTMVMYAYAKVDETGKMPDFHFKHLSALMRVTINNRSSSALTIKELKFDYGENKVFLNEESELIFYNDDYSNPVIFKSRKDAIWESSEKSSIPVEAGEIYDIMYSVLPSGITPDTNSTMKVTINESDGTSALMTEIEGFTGVPIKPGYRYWFDLTLTADGKLVQTGKLPAYSWYTANKDTNTFTLFSAKELREFAKLVNGDSEALAAVGASEAVDFTGKTVKIAEGVTTIDLNNEPWTPIGSTSNTAFKGTFNGSGCHITGLNVNVDTNYAGLFGYISSSTVSNLRVSGSVTGKIHVGGIVGQCMSSTIENCIFSGTAEGINVGGIAGMCGNSTKIIGCYTTGSVKASGARGLDDYSAGGIAGTTIYNTIERCYSMADVTGEESVGGIVGTCLDSTIKQCYATGAISGTKQVGGIVGFFQTNDSPITNCISLNSSLRRTTGSEKSFGYIFGFITNDDRNMNDCAAYYQIPITTESGGTISSTYYNSSLTKEYCLKNETYTSRGFTYTYWDFDAADPWQYLPWNNAFKSFPGITDSDYKIAVPDHLK